jgi:hypothetical protein
LAIFRQCDNCFFGEHDQVIVLCSEGVLDDDSFTFGLEDSSMRRSRSLDFSFQQQDVAGMSLT